jgi:hypothetical protein
MNGNQLVRRTTVLGEDGQAALIGPPFRIVGVGDMDGDGKDDIVWHHDDSGETQIWFMNGNQLVRRTTVLGEDGQAALIGPPFRIVGVGDGNMFRGRMRDRIHEQYLASGGTGGPLGYPTSEVQFSGNTASRQYRGGSAMGFKDAVGLLGVNVEAIATREARVTFVGFRCVDLSNEVSATDEPYFVVTIDDGKGLPLVKKFGPFENTDKGSEVGVGEVVSPPDMAPNPLAIRVAAYENDEGDPDETAEKIQEEMVKLAQQAQSFAAAAGAGAADGPGVGPSAAAGAAGLLAGPLGAMAAVGIVSLFGLGDDFIGQDVALVFQRPDDVSTPPPLGEFRGNSFNKKLDINGGDAGGRHELFFDVQVVEQPKAIPVGP